MTFSRLPEDVSESDTNREKRRVIDGLVAA
jgi:hypothetical protein